jgi:hypothetical protein
MNRDGYRNLDRKSNQPVAQLVRRDEIRNAIIIGKTQQISCRNPNTSEHAS